MIEIASAAMPQLVFPSPLLARSKPTTLAQICSQRLSSPPRPPRKIRSHRRQTTPLRNAPSFEIGSRCSFRRLTNTRRRRSNPHSSPQPDRRPFPLAVSFPWRFSNAGPASARRQAHHEGPASENLHTSRHHGTASSALVWAAENSRGHFCARVENRILVSFPVCWHFGLSGQCAGQRGSPSQIGSRLARP